MSYEEDSQAQALSILEKALRDAVAVVPLEDVIRSVTVMFPVAGPVVETGDAQHREHGRVQKVSVSMPEKLISTVRERAGHGEFSRYVTEAIERRVSLDLLDELAGWLDATYGPVPAEHMEHVEREWARVVSGE